MLIVVWPMPILMLAYHLALLENIQVARELENPFQNVPNDVPLNNFQAQYNESLLQMFTGYHPDAHWEVVEKKEEQTSVPSSFPTFREETLSNDEDDVPSIAEEKQDVESDVELGKS